MTTATLNSAALQDRAAILTIIDGMKKSRHDKNPQALAAPYAPDVTIFSLAPPLAHHGIDLAQTLAWFDTWESPVEIESRDFDITIDGDIAFCHGYMRMDGKKKGVEKPVSFWMRETLCLKRDGRSWRIVHEHTSVPFYMDGSLRLAFDLKP